MNHGDRIKLNRILGMLGSAHAGERASAALAAHRLLARTGLSWWDLIGGQKSGAGGGVVRTAHEWGIDHARAAEARLRQLRMENEALRRELAMAKERLVRRTQQEIRSRLET